MNTRELSGIASRLKVIIDTAGDGGISKLAGEIETAILQSEMISGDDKTNLRTSKERGVNHYKIDPSDSEILKDAKATINLLYSIDAALPTVILPTIDKAMSVLETGSRVGAAGIVASTAYSATMSYISAKWQDSKNALSKVVGDITDFAIDPYNDPEEDYYSSNQKTPHMYGQAKQLMNDVTVFSFHMKQLSNLMPSVTGLSDQSLLTLSTLQKSLDGTNLQNACLTIQSHNNTDGVLGGARNIGKTYVGKSASNSQEPGSVGSTLMSVKEYAFNQLTQREIKVYYDEASDRFRLPEKTESVQPANINAMIAYNISDRSRKTLDHVEKFMNSWNKSAASSASQIPAMLGLVVKLGKVLQDIDKLNTGNYSELAREDLHKGIAKLLEAIGPNLPQLATIALETELRTGLKDGALLSKIETMSKDYEKLAQKYGIHIPSKYPYSIEKAKVIGTLTTESKNRVADLNRAQVILAKQSYMSSPDMENLLALKSAAATINSIAGNELQAHLEQSIKKATGMDELEKDIKAAEAVVFEISQENNNTSVPFDDHDERLGEALDKVKELYGIRDEMLNNPQDRHYSSNGPAAIGILREGLITQGGAYDDGSPFQPEVLTTELHKLGAAIDKAKADISGLVEAENSNISRMAALSPTDTKRQQLRNMGNIGKEAIATQRHQNAIEIRASDRDRNLTINSATVTKTANITQDPVLQSIIEKEKGSVTLACEKARKSLIDNTKPYLTDEQQSLLNVKNNGLYTADKRDGLLVSNIKQISNTLAKVEALMSTINQISKHIDQGGFAYNKILDLMPVINRQMSEIISEMMKTNQALADLRGALSNITSNENNTAISQVFSSISDIIPSGLLQAASESSYLSVLGPQYQGLASKLVAQTQQFASNIDRFARNVDSKSGFARMSVDVNNNKNSVESNKITIQARGAINLLNLSTAKEQSVINQSIDTIINQLYMKIEKPPTVKPDLMNAQILDQSKYGAGSNDYKLVGHINALIELKHSLAASELSAKGRRGSISGVQKFLIRMKNVYDHLSATDSSILKGMAPEIKALLESVEPIIANVYATTAITEKMLGTRDIFTSQLDQHVTSFTELAKSYGAELKGSPPYTDTQTQVAVNESRRLKEAELEERKTPNADTKHISTQQERVSAIIRDLRSVASQKIEQSDLQSHTRPGM